MKCPELQEKSCLPMLPPITDVGGQFTKIKLVARNLMKFSDLQRNIFCKFIPTPQGVEHGKHECTVQVLTFCVILSQIHIPHQQGRGVCTRVPQKGGSQSTHVRGLVKPLNKVLSEDPKQGALGNSLSILDLQSTRALHDMNFMLGNKYSTHDIYFGYKDVYWFFCSSLFINS